MSLAFRVIYAASLVCLFALGLALHIKTPMAGPGWGFWCVLSFALLLVTLRELLRAGLPSGRVARRLFSVDPGSGLFPMAFLLVVLALAILHTFLGRGGPSSLARLTGSYMGFGLWAPLGVMLFFGLKLGKANMSWVDGILTLFALVLAVFVLAMGGNYYHARIVVISVICIVFMIRGNRFLKVLVIGAMAAYFAMGVAVILGRVEPLYPQYVWAFAGMSELNASLDLILRQAVFRMAGLWGTGGQYIAEVGLPLSGYMGFNCLPYLALLGGYMAVGLYLLSLFLLMGSLLLNILEIRGGWAGTAAASVWFLLAVDQYISFLALITTSALIMGGGTVGLPFIGSFGSGFILLALTLFVLSAHKVARENSRIQQSAAAAEAAAAEAGAAVPEPTLSDDHGWAPAVTLLKPDALGQGLEDTSWEALADTPGPALADASYAPQADAPGEGLEDTSWQALAETPAPALADTPEPAQADTPGPALDATPGQPLADAAGAAGPDLAEAGEADLSEGAKDPAAEQAGPADEGEDGGGIGTGG
ncbi:MAG: hypothetical protein LBF40_06335 [Deltaproteobacteria bacterium]|jgi:hypothetical protein|nr:hypothetical protein [Deltaproteobacteria bacterium]